VQEFEEEDDEEGSESVEDSEYEEEEGEYRGVNTQQIFSQLANLGNQFGGYNILKNMQQQMAYADL
jgi:hypothetical protein